MADRRIFIIGSSNVDFIMKTETLPRKGESTTDATFMQTFGGKGANQAVAAARAGGDAFFVNCVGDDPYAELMVDGYRESGLKTEFVYREKEIWSGTALVMIGADGDNYITVAPGANYRLTPERIRVLEPQLTGAAWILIQYEVPPDTVAEIITIARKIRVPVAWNFAPAREFEPGLLPDVELVIANESEAEYLAGGAVATVDDAREAARVIHAKGVSAVIITLGKNGSWVKTADEEFHCPAFEVDAVDATAAGDVYCGCLVTALSENQPFRDAVRFATAGSALAVQVLGAQPSAPWRKDIETFLLNRHEEW
ncbi:MAG: ribokinase [Spirochaetaceae bacterium]|nr:MAG: ribokinase [Spirochaetaceae bacterium]